MQAFARYKDRSRLIFCPGGGELTWQRFFAGRCRQSGGIWIVLCVIGAIFALLLVVGVLPRIWKNKELSKMAAETVGAIPPVRTVTAKVAPFDESGVLPGNIGAIQYATIYARVDGYLKSRLVDIGDHVKSGQLLAEIDTPTVDQELEQALADLAQARAQVVSSLANLKEAQAQDVAARAQVEKADADKEYAAVTARRWENMASRGAVTLQSRDEKVRALSAQIANLKAAQAQNKAADQAVEAARSEVDVARALVTAKLAVVKRFQVQKSFKYVTAPFDGVITLRKVDPGQLITAGSQSTALELFQMAQIDHLRIYVNAPQTVSRYLTSGLPADVLVPEFPERVFPGVITNVSGALDPETRTRQTEIHVDNPDHSLLPGMYAQVKITAPRVEPWIRIPSTAIVPRGDGMSVVVADGGKVHYQKVLIGRDFGDDVEIRDGLKGGQLVVVSPAVDLREGEAVKPTPYISN